jgi:hypothetical protein
VKNHASRPWILNRKTKGIKFDRTKIITCKLTNRKKIAHNVRRNQNIVEMEGGVGCGKDGSTMTDNRNRMTIAYNYG